VGRTWHRGLLFQPQNCGQVVLEPILNASMKVPGGMAHDQRRCVCRSCSSSGKAIARAGLLAMATTRCPCPDGFDRTPP
jgi:hypothetical protein